MDFRKILNESKYDFLRTHPRLGNKIMLLGVSGSYGYGTNREGSDIDFRGVTLNLPSDLLGLTSFDQYEDVHTDTVIYSFKKLVNLLLNCNPNTIEILGLDEDKYLIKSPFGQELLDHKKLFLSKRAAASFGHYADAQLRRLQNAIARDAMSQPSRETLADLAAIVILSQSSCVRSQGSMELSADSASSGSVAPLTNAMASPPASPRYRTA